MKNRMSRFNEKTQVSLRGKARRLNRIASAVENWYIMLDGREFNPPQYPDVKIWWDKHDNLVFGERVEMHGFGEIYKICVLTGHRYRLEEIPEKMWRTVWDEIYHSEGEEDACNPLISDDDNEYRKRGFDPENTIITVAKWWPPDDYVKQLVEKRNFMTAPEFEVYAKVIDRMHDGKAPNYIDPNPFVSVPDRIH